MSQALTDVIGRNIVGPVVHQWLLGLDQYFSYFGDQRTSFLYCARAGVRINRLYELYLKGLDREVPPSHHLFWASRISLCKGTYTRQPERASQIIAHEYFHQPLRDVVAGLMRNADERLSVNLEALTDRDLDAHGQNFPGWLKSEHRLVEPTRSYLEDCSKQFDAHLQTWTDNSDRIVLVDSGWRGTMQSLLTHAYPDTEWAGLYVGRILTPGFDPAIADKVIGILFQAESVDLLRPETSIVAHRHLFETMLEPNGPSIEDIPGGSEDAIVRQQIEQNLADPLDPEADRVYARVLDYIKDNAGLGPAEIVANYQKALPELARILLRPSREEAFALACKDRSADFGKSLLVPVLITDPDPSNPAHANADLRVAHALWSQGQTALEFSGLIRTERQDRITSASDLSTYFDPIAEGGESDRAERPDESELPPSVAIITRTKNRPLLLKRAATSVAGQTFSDYSWVVVNDGGDEEAAKTTVLSGCVDLRRITFVSNVKSLGMEAASNVGIRAVNSKYVLIHDDDDSLHPDFLKRAVEFLDSEAGARYGGVVTGSIYVSEEIVGDTVVEHERSPYKGWLRNIHLSEMLAENTFPPIAFLYRRSVYDEIGGYDEEFPVLGDWVFNLEFLLKADIKVIPDPLAYYHHRDRGDSSKDTVYSNSVIGGQTKHEEFSSVARNKFMRRHAESNAIAAGAIMAYFGHDLRASVRNLAEGLNKPQPVPVAPVSAAPVAPAPNEDATREIDRLWLLNHLSGFRAAWNRPKLHPSKSNASETQMASLSRVLQKHHRKVTLGVHPTFDEEAYLVSNADVREAVYSGKFSSGYVHFLAYGVLEGRPRPTKQS
ncbi:MAG: glycosyltransferase [Pseudomonadota bacterium]